MFTSFKSASLGNCLLTATLIGRGLVGRKKPDKVVPHPGELSVVVETKFLQIHNQHLCIAGSQKVFKYFLSH